MTGPSDPSPSHVMYSLVGLALHGFVGFFIAFSTLVAPLWAVVALGVVWVAAAVVGVREWRRRAWVPLAVSSATALVWIAALTLGDVLLGWTA